MTSDELCNRTIEENRPIDWGWINHVKRTYTEKEKLEFCRENIEYACNTKGCSKQLIGRAASKLKDYLF